MTENFMNLPSKEQFDVQNALLASIASKAGGIDIESWRDVQRIVRMGLAKTYFTVGDQFIAEYNGTPHIWEVIGIDHDIPTDKNFQHSLTIQSRDCLFSAQFSAAQALYYAKTTLPAGKYHFYDRIDNVNQAFTLNDDIPEGGQIVLNYNRDTITSYRNNTKTEPIESVLLTKNDSEGTELVGLNNISGRYGSNNYLESAIRQFLNSKESTFEWKSKTNYDRISSGAPYTGAGFLNLLDSELTNVLGRVDKQVARNTVTDGGGQDVFSDKVFLLSRVEVYGGTEGATTGEEPYEFYSNMANVPDTGSVDWRIKLLNGSPRNWWLRSPSVGSSHYVRCVHVSGSLRNDYAYSTFGVSPACVII